MTERALPVTILEPAGIDPELLDHTLSLRFDLGQFDPRITFTRNSSATYFGSDGLLKTAAANEPRIDYDPVTKVCKGFLVEESRTNLLTYSEQFGSADWVKGSSTITPAAITSPDGTLSGAKLTFNAGASVSNSTVSQTVSVSAETFYTISLFAKAELFDELRFALITRTAANVYVGEVNYIFNLTAGTATVAALGGTPPTDNSASITHVGGGWYRCAVTAKTTSTVGRISHTARNQRIGDGTSGIYIWGAQLEVGAFPTSYIKTEATAATRAADSAVMTGANFSSWYRQDEGTFLLKASLMNAGGVGQNNIVTLGSSSTVFYRLSGATSLRSYDGTNVISSDPVLSPGALFSAALTYGSGEMAQSVNGLAVKSAAFDGDFGGNLDVGGGYSDRKANAHIARLTYYPKRLANAKLQALTQ